MRIGDDVVVVPPNRVERVHCEDMATASDTAPARSGSRVDSVLAALKGRNLVVVTLCYFAVTSFLHGLAGAWHPENGIGGCCSLPHRPAA